jgi:hypothetical protein
MIYLQAVRMNVDYLRFRETFIQLSRRDPELVGTHINFSGFIVPSAKFFSQLTAVSRFPFLPKKFGMRIADVSRGILQALQDIIFFGDRSPKDGIDQSPGGSGDIDGLIHGGVIWDPHFVELIHTQPQHLAGCHIEARRPEPLNNEIEIRPVPNDPVEGLGNKRLIDGIQPGSLQRLMENLVSKFSTTFPTLKRL